jgi:hypothetical protein
MSNDFKGPVVEVFVPEIAGSAPLDPHSLYGAIVDRINLPQDA